MKKVKIVNVIAWDGTTRINGYEGSVNALISDHTKLVQWNDGSFSFPYSDKPQFELSNADIITVETL